MTATIQGFIESQRAIHAVLLSGVYAQAVADGDWSRVKTVADLAQIAGDRMLTRLLIEIDLKNSGYGD